MDTSRESVQKLVWDEEDRLLGVDLRTESDRGQPHIAAYTYDAGGERGIRYVPRQQEGVSSGTTAGYAQDMDIMLYPNALITVRPQELPEDFEIGEMHPSFTFTTYTKHYYLGSERINSKLGTVKDLGVLCEQMGGNDLIEEMNRRVEEADERLEDLHTDLDKDIRLNSPYLYSREHQFVCDFKSHNPKMYDAYWYHSDHLGSSSFITNTTGEISQHMEYLPFGETLVEEHLNSYNSPFKFNDYGEKSFEKAFCERTARSAEYDAETGNYYYGARYMNPKWSTFLTPDPALESYPGISPYAYTLNNPVRYVDPTGMYVESGDDWYENDTTGELEWRNSQDATISDSRGNWNNIGEELLTFDGENLTYYTQERLSDGNLKLNSTSFSAVSGRQQEDGTFDYSKQAQATPFSGPLPEGDYSINPSAIQWWTNQSFTTKTAALVKKGTWPGGLFAWGVARSWISPKEVNVTNPTTGESILRNNFSIHGGTSPGSAGCIDLTTKDLPFFRMLEKSKESKIRLRVSY